MSEVERIYAVGDIHGRSEQLWDVLALINRDRRRRPAASTHVVFLGDYVDRGPDSRGVLDLLCEFSDDGEQSTFLLGNHEDLLMRYIGTDTDSDEATAGHRGAYLHPSIGSPATLASYGVSWTDYNSDGEYCDALREAIPETHHRFLGRCELYKRIGPYLFVHAGLQPGLALEHQDRHDLIWIRERFLEHRGDFGFKVVHGHTPVKCVEHHANRLAIDTGAAYGGPISCVVLEGECVSLLKPRGLEPCPVGSGIEPDSLWVDLSDLPDDERGVRRNRGRRLSDREPSAGR